MLSFLPAPILITISIILFAASLLFWAFLLFYPVLLFKIILSPTPLRKYPDQLLMLLGQCWIATNNAIIAFTQDITWDIQLDGQLNKNTSYLVTSNHQSWVDIAVIQRIFSGVHRAPFPRFFIKQELIWVPILGLCWWGLDFPFMKRYSREYLEKNPHMRGKDMEATRKACERFKENPVSVINFFEGTRFTENKHQRQQSPFKHLLKPRAGGAAFTLDAMGGAITQLVDFTIIYPTGKKQFTDLFSNRVKRIIVRIQVSDIPEQFLNGDYDGDPEFKEQFQNWVNELWEQKDRKITDELVSFDNN